MSFTISKMQNMGSSLRDAYRGTFLVEVDDGRIQKSNDSFNESGSSMIIVNLVFNEEWGALPKDRQCNRGWAVCLILKNCMSLNSPHRSNRMGYLKHKFMGVDRGMEVISSLNAFRLLGVRKNCVEDSEAL